MLLVSCSVCISREYIHEDGVLGISIFVSDILSDNPGHVHCLSSMLLTVQLAQWVYELYNTSRLQI